eukprot:SAG11_NODE_28818_length_317_cov_1.568807_1_plen_70_part_10
MLKQQPTAREFLQTHNPKTLVAARQSEAKMRRHLESLQQLVGNDDFVVRRWLSWGRCWLSERPSYRLLTG